MPLDPQTVAALRALHRLQARERFAAGEGYEDSGLILVDELGQPLAPEAYGDRFAKPAAAAGLPRIGVHDVRHTAASLMHESGAVPMRTLAAMLGHPDASFTLCTYAHSSEESLTAASATLASLFEGRSSGPMTKCDT